MASKKILFLLVLLCSLSIKSFANDFEGSITLTKQSPYDTSYYEFSVKQNMVRVDFKNASAQVLQSLIINLVTEKITALSPNHKLYTEIKKTNKVNFDKSDYTLIKTENYKTINGYKCYMWRVRNIKLHTDISFWVSEKGLDFFPKVIEILNSSEDYSDLCNYFMQVGQNNSFFPILIVEHTLLKEEISKMAVIQITNRPIKKEVFEIPKNYKLLRF